MVLDFKSALMEEILRDMVPVDSFERVLARAADGGWMACPRNHLTREGVV